MQDFCLRWMKVEKGLDIPPVEETVYEVHPFFKFFYFFWAAYMTSKCSIGLNWYVTKTETAK